MGEIKVQLEEEEAAELASQAEATQPAVVVTSPEPMEPVAEPIVEPAEPVAEVAVHGLLKVGLTGNHGWFFRNRKANNVVLALRTNGEYGDLKKAKLRLGAARGEVDWRLSPMFRTECTLPRL